MICFLALLVASVPTQPLSGAEGASIVDDPAAILDLYKAGELLDAYFLPPTPEHVDSPRTRLEVGDPHLVWITDLTLWTESLGTKRVVFYFDKRLMPDGLTEAEQLAFWEALRYVSLDQWAFEANGQKDYSAFYRAYVGEPALVPVTVQVERLDPILGFVTEDVTTWEPENYTIIGRYNSNPGELDRDAILSGGQ